MHHIIKNVIFTIISAMLLYSLSKSLFTYKDKLSFYDQYSVEQQKLADENKQLKSNIKKAQDSYFVEQQLREKLNLLKKDEVAIILPQQTPTPTPPPFVDKPTWQQWKDLFLP